MSGETNVVKVAANLTLACLFSGVIIAGVHTITAPEAARQKELAKTQAMQELVKDADQFTPIEGKNGWFEAKKGGKLLAIVLPSESKGYGGAIKLLVAIAPDGKVYDFKVLGHNETPGLGDNIKKPKFKDQFAGKSLAQLNVVKQPVTDGSAVEAITGATISSKAVTAAIREAVEAVAAEKTEQQPNHAANTQPITDPERLTVLRELIPQATNFHTVVGKLNWVAVEQNNQLLGYVLPVESNGYGGILRLAVGVSTDGRIMAAKTMAHKETRQKAEDALAPAYLQQFAGLTLADLNGGVKIDSVAGATVTSKAVLTAMITAVDEVNAYQASGRV